MQDISAGARRYDSATILLHWSTAGLVAFEWLGAQTIDWFPRGLWRTDARSVHILIGAALVLLLAARILWRLSGGRRLPAADPGALGMLAKATHWRLYGLLCGMLLVGLALEWARGDSIFGVFRIPAYEPVDHALADQLQGIHALIGWLILGLTVLHAGAALLRRLVWRDGVLERMLRGE